MSKDKKFWWCDTESALSGGKNGPIKYGDPIPTGRLSKDRLAYFAKLGQVTDEQPDDNKAVKQSEVDTLRRTVGEQETLITDLETKIKKTPKGVKAANDEIKSLKKKLEDLTESAKQEKDDATTLLETADTEISALKAQLKKAGIEIEVPKNEGGE